MRKLIPVLMIVAACAPTAAGTEPPAATVAPAASPALAGTYLLRQVNGRDLPAASPTEPNVELSRGVLQLSPDGTFSMALTGRRNQEPTPGTEQMSGSYTVTGDVLALTMPNGNGPRFNFTRAGAALTLRDDMGNTYTLARQ
ncbi:MAG TPA: hypothetical protein VFJ16_25675 [Longimicrobium sp.]|nr:hypothetical protein [Longimicrobium sp.]